MLGVTLSVVLLSGLLSIELVCKLLHNRVLYTEVFLGYWLRELLSIELFSKRISIRLVKILPI